MSQIYYKNNRLQQIRGFCNTILCGSVTKAAEVMNLSQSSVSLQIMALERDLGKTLLKRNKRGSKKFEITEDGKLFYEMALPILNSTDDLCERFFLKSAKHHESFLKIAGHHSAFSIVLPNVLKKMKDGRKELKMELSYLPKQEAFSKLLDDKIDVAVYPLENTSLLPRGLDFQKICNYKPVLIAPLKHPLEKIPDKKITFEEIGKYNYIHTGNYAISDIMKYNIAASVLKSDIELNNGSWDVLKSLVKAGLGVTIFHGDYCKNDKDLIKKNVSHLSPHIAYYAIFKKGGKPKKLVSDLIDFCLE